MHDEAFAPRDVVVAARGGQSSPSTARTGRSCCDGFEAALGAHRDHFDWTVPGGGFFSVFSFKGDGVRTDDAFIEQLVADHGVVAIPMYDFYPDDARARDADAGFNQLRLSFCFSESVGRGTASVISPRR